MKVNIYYGGRGMLGDPTLYVINKMQEVLEELNVNIERFNLYEIKNNIPTLPQTLKEADGIILATTVEWYGIGGYMQQFLDACWLYGDKEKISQIYMCPIVMSTTYGERDARTNLAVAWEILGGRPCSGICGYIEDTARLEMSEEYATIIEKKAENMYRTINQKLPSFPASNQAVKQRVAIPTNIDLNPQEAEQLSQYAADDGYVQQQKEDIQELASLFKDMLGQKESETTADFIGDFEQHFKPQSGLKATYKLIIEGGKKSLFLSVDEERLECTYENSGKADVEMQLSQDTLKDIVYRKMTFQRAFMGGAMRMRGDFKLLRTLDQIFVFAE